MKKAKLVATDVLRLAVNVIGLYGLTSLGNGIDEDENINPKDKELELFKLNNDIRKG